MEAEKHRPARPAMAMPRTGLDLPSADEIRIAIQSHGGMQALGPLFAQASMAFMSGDAGISAQQMCEAVGEQIGCAPGIAKTVFAMGILCSALYFNDKYAAQVEAGLEASRTVN